MKTTYIDIQQMHYDNGQLWQEVPFLGETIHGVFREWHENGVLAFETPMSNGLRNGVCKQWSEEGQLLGTY
jgi:antitoxin component YwqK of YwqJK toxin-antitoxin module